MTGIAILHSYGEILFAMGVNGFESDADKLPGRGKQGRRNTKSVGFRVLDFVWEDPNQMMRKLRYGNTNTYYVDGILVDTDMPDTLPAFYRELKQKGLRADDIRYVLATHYHPDHMGLISQLMTLGVKLILVDKQREYVHFSDPIFGRQPKLRYRPIPEKEAIVIGCAQSRQFLRSIGMNGEIVPTESHSPDGIALITDEGDCFVGDLEPMQYLAAYGDPSPLKQDWDRILSCRPVNIYFGHMNDQRIR